MSNERVTIDLTCKFHKEPRTDTIRVKRADLNRWMEDRVRRTGDGSYICRSCWEQLDA